MVFEVLMVLGVHLVGAVGITLTGEKHVLGFVETGTENEAVLTPYLKEEW